MIRLGLPLLVILAAGAAQARPIRLARCDSGKTGRLDLYVEKTDAGFVLTSKDSADGSVERVFSGTVVRALHEKMDRRHHVYVFDLEDGALQQAAGLDEKRCHDDGERASCHIDAISIKLARHGPRHPQDDGMHPLQSDQAVTMDNGGPQNCMVYASRALTELLRAGDH